MKTQLEAAHMGRLTTAMREVARSEGIEAQVLLSSIARGEVVIMRRRKGRSGSGKGSGRR